MINANQVDSKGKYQGSSPLSMKQRLPREPPQPFMMDGQDFGLYQMEAVHPRSWAGSASIQ